MAKFKMGLRGVRCCLCGKTIRGFGNNPFPLDKREGARCCDKCNGLVLVERLRLAQKEPKHD